MPRRRRPFTAPSSSDEDSAGELDEEHQEALIASLATTDERNSTLYRFIFVALSALALLPPLRTALSVSSSAGSRERLLALISVSSIACSAWVLWSFPAKRVNNGKGKGKASIGSGMDEGPLVKYLPWLNGALAGLLLVVGLVALRKQGRGGRIEEEAWRLALPAVIFVLNTAVRQLLAPLDLEDLQRARYEYKGA